MDDNLMENYQQKREKPSINFPPWTLVCVRFVHCMMMMTLSRADIWMKMNGIIFFHLVLISSTQSLLYGWKSVRRWLNEMNEAIAITLTTNYKTCTAQSHDMSDSDSPTILLLIVRQSEFHFTLDFIFKPKIRYCGYTKCFFFHWISTVYTCMEWGSCSMNLNLIFWNWKWQCENLWC